MNVASGIHWDNSSCVIISGFIWANVHVFRPRLWWYSSGWQHSASRWPAGRGWQPWLEIKVKGSSSQRMLMKCCWVFQSEYRDAWRKATPWLTDVSSLFNLHRILNHWDWRQFHYPCVFMMMLSMFLILGAKIASKLHWARPIVWVVSRWAYWVKTILEPISNQNITSCIFVLKVSRWSFRILLVM